MSGISSCEMKCPNKCKAWGCLGFRVYILDTHVEQLAMVNLEPPELCASACKLSAPPSMNAAKKTWNGGAGATP